MRCVVVQVTGLAGAPAEDLGGKTPLEVAATPVLDDLASHGIFGLMRTIAEHGAITISAATAAILGTDPSADLPAPGAVAAAGLDLALPEGAVAACLDLVTVAEREGIGPVLVETRFPGLTESDAGALAGALDEALAPAGVRVHAGVGGNHVAVSLSGSLPVFSGPPDVAIGQTLAQALAAEPAEGGLRTFLSRARAALWEHPVCVRLRAQGLVAPSDVWPWGVGPAQTMPAFVDHFGVRGVALAGSLLPRGIARLSGLAVEPALAGAEGWTLAARVARALALCEEFEFVLLQTELVDTAGGRGDARAKVDAIARLDADVVGPLATAFRAAGGDWRLTVLSDVTTSCATRRDTADPVPFVVGSPRDAGRASAPRRRFTERNAREEGIFLGEACTLLERLLRR